MNVIIATRSRSDALYAKASEFWPADIPRHRVQHMHGWHAAAEYLWALTQLDADLVVNCDEDCFVHSWDVVDALLHEMASKRIAYVGMPDDKLNCRHRNNATFVHNPFFTVFAPALLRTVLSDPPPMEFNPPECAIHEPFNSLYAAFRRYEGAWQLQGHDHRDGISTSLSYRGIPFALHSWYSREYDGNHRSRIDALFAEAMLHRMGRNSLIAD